MSDDSGVVQLAVLGAGPGGYAHEPHAHGSFGATLIARGCPDLVIEQVTSHQEFAVTAPAAVEHQAGIDGIEAYTGRGGYFPHRFAFLFPAQLTSVKIEGDAVNPGECLLIVFDLSQWLDGYMCLIFLCFA